jgi:excisionase family DNA binding protein
VRELERERVTVQEAARQLGITESAVRKRAQRGQLQAQKVTEGKKERLYIFLDSEEDKFPEPFRERYMRSLEDRVKTLEDEVYRQQAIILSMSQSMQALTGASETTEASETVEEAPERAEAHSAGGEGEAQEGARRPWWRRMFGS